MSKNNIERVYTDTPIIDEIVYQVKKMIYDGIVLKDSDEADKYDTVDIDRYTDTYASIIRGAARFLTFEYDYNDIKKLPMISDENARRYARDNSSIPNNLREPLFNIKKKDFLDNYSDPNPYYRMLNGIPNVGETGILLTKEQLKKVKDEDGKIYGNRFIHEFTANEIKILDAFGVLEEIQETYPEKKYLWHLGERKIDTYMARNAPKFSLLYLPPCESNEIYNKFKDIINRNRDFIIHCLYTDAYKFQSDYYDAFLMSMIIVQSFNDMISLSPEYIIQRELFDLRTIQYVFESQGVKFFPDIPLKYQKRLVKNLNRLIKYKSSDKCLVDIVSLFGFDNIELFKYWILKDPIMNDDGTYRHDVYYDAELGKEVENLEGNYELKFIKVPFGGSAEESLLDPTNIVSYDDIVSNDTYWNGIYTAEYVKHKILEHEFNMHISKYLGMETVYSMTEMTMQLTYFINMLLYSNIDTNRLLVSVPELSSTEQFTLIDLFIGLYSLGYIYKNVQDNIIYEPVKYMAVCGFNFEVDMGKLAGYVKDKGYTLEELGVSDFQIPSSGILSFNQLLEVYTKNRNIHDHLVKEMNNANDKDIYDIYKTIYQSLMVTQLNFDYFTQFGDIPKTYMEFLRLECSHLYASINECAVIEKESERRDMCSKYIGYITEAIQIYLKENEFEYIFHGIPTASLNFVKQYLFEVLNFFKSYKTDFTKVNTVYKFDSRLENKIQIIDKVLFGYNKYFGDNTNIRDLMKTLIKINPKEVIGIIDYMFMDITRWKTMLMEDNIDLRDKFREIILNLLKKDYGSPYKDEITEWLFTFIRRDVYVPVDKITNNLNIIFSDNASPSDYINIETKLL